MGKNKMVLGLGVALVFAVAVIGVRYFNDGPSVKPVESEHVEGSSGNEHHAHPQALGVAKQPSAMTAGKQDDHAHHDHDHTADVNDGQPKHIDMLSDEMKQAIKDKLLLHGPMEVIRHPDGRIELPSNGRFTQMPVAVEMPDGTIQIREYSTLPE